jgi:hypothetical protein
MQSSRSSQPWLSDQMARALAAMSPPLRKRDVFQAADELTANTKSAHVIRHLLPRGADLMQARRVVEALTALRDIDM